MYLDRVIHGFQDELRKIAAAAPKGKAGMLKAVAPLAAGAALWEAGRRANTDRRLGRQVRLQQGM